MQTAPTWMGVALLVSAWTAGCGRDSKPPPEPAASAPHAAASQAATASASSAGAPAVTELRHPAVRRLVAIGDVHGDLAAARAVLRLGGAIDAEDRWIGGDLTVVQVGDQIDRGDDDRAVIDLFDRLAEQAEAAGGAVRSLNGNHELMNATFDFRYVTEGAYAPFAELAAERPPDPRIAAALHALPEKARGRAAAFAPGGPYARRLARRHLVVIVGDSVFVHGGVLPKHVRYGLDRMDREVRAFLEGKAPPPGIALAEDGPVWSRRFSAAPDAEDCNVLREVLDALGAKRMVVGHTPQRGGIAPACDDKVWRIDVGLSRFYGGPTEALEIAADRVRVLRPGDGAPSAAGQQKGPASLAAEPAR